MIISTKKKLNIKHILSFLNLTIILYLNNFSPVIMFDQSLLEYYIVSSSKRQINKKQLYVLIIKREKKYKQSKKYLMKK